MDAITAIRTRRSIRSFNNQPVPPDIIETIIDSGRLAPSANNVQPWEFVVITREETRKKIAEITDYGKFIAQSPVCIATFCKDTKYYLEDGCAATENMLISAHALGLAGCWVAGDKKRYCQEIAHLLGVPPHYKLVSLIPLGYSDKTVNAHHKRDLGEVLHWERF
ncbi:MAG: nitroreductase family protein [Nitrospinae bacterium]|nr:nitroreductase family protein [Nitrospinota bacterium]